MKQLGFIFGTIEVEVDGFAYDLHNHFDFQSINYDLEKKEIKLSWSKRTLAPIETPSSIIVSFVGVSHFSTISRDKEIPFTEDSCVESIGYVGEKENTEEYYHLDNPSEELHCIIVFHSGLIIRLFSDFIECKVNA